MDSTAHITALIDQLDDNLDNLQDALKTILNKSLTDIAAGYPLLDRAKLFVLVTYAIESAIFSFLRLHGTSAREHPVFRELERVKQYFQKIKLAETAEQKPGMRLDQAAAERFIKHALAGNQAKTVEAELVKSTKAESKTELGNAKKRKAAAIEQSAADNAVAKTGNDSDGDDSEGSSTAGNFNTAAVSNAVVPGGISEANAVNGEAQPAKLSKSQRRSAAKRAKKAKAAAAEASANATTTEPDETPAKKKQKKDKKSKSDA